jgi:hypothetical protein
VGGHATGSQDPTEGDDCDPACARPPERCSGALGPSPADIGVVEQDGATAGRPPPGGRGDLEGGGIRAHVAHGCSGPDEETGRPASDGKAHPDGTGQTFQLRERRSRGPGRGRHGEGELERATRGRCDAGGVASQKVIEELPNHRREPVTGLRDG